MSDTAPEAITAFHIIAEILRELDQRFGPEFSTSVLRRVDERRQDFRAEGSDQDADALVEGLDWLNSMLKRPAS